MDTRAQLRENILVVDDEEIVRKCCEKTLRPVGYYVDTTGEGEVGLEMAGRKKYDLLITDLKMPNMDGIELMNGIKSIQPGIRVIIVTGYITAGTREAAVEAGANICLEKPFCPEDLIKAVIDATK